MARLSVKMAHAFYFRGIHPPLSSLDWYGIKLTSAGLYWLLNCIYEKYSLGTALNNILIRDAARFTPRCARDLKIVATALPTHSYTYYWLTIYLDGTPPRMMLSFYCSYISEGCTMLPVSDMPFKVTDKRPVMLQLDKTEVELLLRGEVLVVGVKSQNVQRGLNV